MFICGNKRIQKYFKAMPDENPLTKFVVGKYNLDLGDKYTGICGAMVGKFNDEITIYSYFSAFMEGHNLWGFSHSVDSQKLCAISENATIFGSET